MYQFKDHNQQTLFSKIGFSGIGILYSKNSCNLGLLLRSAAICGNDFVFTIGDTYSYQKADTTRSQLNIPIFHFDTFDSFKTCMPPNARLVGVEMVKRAQYLHEFSHPDRAIYLLGAEDKGIPEHILRECQDIIKLPGKISFNVGQVGHSVLLDRMIKRKEYEI